MSGLWRKEFRSVAPFLGLILALTVFGLLDEFLSRLPNTRPLAHTFGSYVAAGWEESIFTFVLVFALASGLLIREFDEDTMEFLD